MCLKSLFSPLLREIKNKYIQNQVPLSIVFDASGRKINVSRLLYKFDIYHGIERKPPLLDCLQLLFIFVSSETVNYNVLEWGQLR